MIYFALPATQRQLIFQMAANLNEYLTTRELADLLRIKERKVYDLVSSGDVPCSRATGKLLFPRKEIDAWLQANASGGSQETKRLDRMWSLGVTILCLNGRCANPGADWPVI